MAADRGAVVAGIDAAKDLIEIAAQRTATGDFRVGDLEALPWPDKSFDWVTGFSAFQFADNKVRALAEARRVSRRSVAIAIPTRASESGIASVFKPLSPLFPAPALESLRDSGIFALSEPGKLDDVLDAAGLRIQHDHEIDCPILFEDAEAALRAFVGAGPTAVAIQHSGESAVGQALAESLRPFARADGRVMLPGRYRVVLTEA
jgi:Methyltransferase domain